VISHGLGSDRNTFAYLARHLASYGFAVAIPEHLGSSAKQLQLLASGRANEVAEPREFLDRPLDIKFLLDALTQSALANRMNLQQVGLLGQSFGGYTALSLAGAPLTINQVQQSCPPGTSALNLSLLLQCRAAELPDRTYNFTDPRIKAAIAINPITSTLLGPDSLSQIRIPVMIVSGTADTVAPALSEQIRPFTWLNTSDRYLSLIVGGTHFSTLAASAPGTDPIPVPNTLIGPSPEQGQRYLNALSVAFFGNYLTQQPQYRPYLTAAYTQSISQGPLALTLTQSAQLTQNLQTQRPIPNP
jgi:predicted dienelactone hydrolase